MNTIPTELYVKETAKGNEETKKELELSDPDGFSLGKLLNEGNRISLGETPLKEQHNG
jgi:hypothetical protein